MAQRNRGDVGRPHETANESRDHGRRPETTMERRKEQNQRPQEFSSRQRAEASLARRQQGRVEQNKNNPVKIDAPGRTKNPSSPERHELHSDLKKTTSGKIMQQGNGRDSTGPRDKSSDTSDKSKPSDAGTERRTELKHKPEEVSSRQRVETSLAHRQEGSDKNETRAAKAAIAEGLVDKSNPVHPSKQGDNSHDLHFQDDREYNRELQQRDPSIGNDAQLVSGYYDRRDNQAFVREQGNTLDTAVHEKLHQKSRSEMPTRLDEGITEHFTRQTAGEVGRLKNIDSRGREITGPVSDYERERIIVGKISATVGEAPLQRAYFDGNTDELRRHMDSVLGKGSYDEIAKALEDRDYKKAEAVLKRGN